MKVFIVSLLVVAALADDYIEKIENASKACGVSGLRELQTLELNADKTKIGSTLFCINKEIGIQDKNGSVDVEKITTHVRTMFKRKDESFQNNMINDCGSPKGETGEEKAFNIMSCIHQKVKH